MPSAFMGGRKRLGSHGSKSSRERGAFLTFSFGFGGGRSKGGLSSSVSVLRRSVFLWPPGTKLLRLGKAAEKATLLPKRKQ